jgi:hypothetical protein
MDGWVRVGGVYRGSYSERYGVSEPPVNLDACAGSVASFYVNAKITAMDRGIFKWLACICIRIPNHMHLYSRPWSLLCAIAVMSTAVPLLGQHPDTKPIVAEPHSDNLTTFDLDFRGGTPVELVDAIQTASGRPLNAIIPPQFADIKIPRLKMNHVDAVHLFQAMYEASITTVVVPNPGYPDSGGNPFRTAFGFKADGKPTDESVWFFSAELPPTEPPPLRYLRFYLLTPYLDSGLTVDDITTAIETGWKMLGHADNAEISFHKETKLLIVVGDQKQLQAVSLALDVLKAPKPSSNANPEHSAGDNKAAK